MLVSLTLARLGTLHARRLLQPSLCVPTQPIHIPKHTMAAWLRSPPPAVLRARRRPAPPSLPSLPASTPTLVQVPLSDTPVLTLAHPSYPLFARKQLVVVRQLEMLNVLVGFEQANKYAIKDEAGSDLGYIVEEDSFGRSLFRNVLRTHRPMRAFILDVHGQVILKIHRPFNWINSRISIFTEHDVQIGHVEQEWHLFRRRYHLFNATQQFARINAPWLSWLFTLENEHGAALAHIDRHFTGFARELFTDTGHYAVRFEAAPELQLALDERAVAMACAITIDFDYFSRERGGFFAFGGFFPFGGFGGFGGVFGGESDELAPQAIPPPETETWLGDTDDTGDDSGLL